MIRFASIGSGSRGNGLIVESADGTSVTRVLVDCGFPTARVVERLAALGVAPQSLSAIVLSHEHLDHVKGAAGLSRRFNIPLWMSPGTRAAMKKRRSAPRLSLFNPHEGFHVGGLHITPIPVPHDAREPTQFLLSDGDRRLVVLTDLGETTPRAAELANGCDAMVLECNYDPILLRDGRYHAALKRRVAGPLGHLSNEAARDFVRSLNRSRLQHLIAAHISQENNLLELARKALAEAVNGDGADIDTATQDEGFGWRTIR